MNWEKIPQRKAEPNFENVLAVLRHEGPERPTLFEFLLNERLLKRLVPEFEPVDDIRQIRQNIAGFYRLGYDFVPRCPGWNVRRVFIY